MTARVLVVGLDGAEPAIVWQLLERGELPTMQRIVERGCSGAMAATAPLVRAMTWTTLATGMRSPRHGVCGDVEIRGDGSGVRPASRQSWRAPAFWERLAAAGLHCATVCWPASRPAAAWNAGTIVDDSFCEPLGPGFDAWPLLPDCIAPASGRDALRELRVHPGDLSAEQMLTLVPLAARIDQDVDDRLGRLAMTLARSSTVHAAATHLLASRDWDLFTVAYSLPADAMRDFIAYRSPVAPHVGSDEAEVYSPVVDHAYRLQDAMLGALLQLAGDAATVVVVSPHGFASGADRPGRDAADRLPASVAWHRGRGWLAAAGPGVLADELVHGARAVDVAPTILALLGWTVQGLDGVAIERIVPPAGAPRAPAPPAGGDDVSDPTALEADADLDPLQHALVQRTGLAWLVNRAEAHFAANELALAASAYRQALDVVPDDWLLTARLARCRLHLGEYDACRSLAANVIDAEPTLPWGHLLSAAALVMSGAGEAADPFLERARAAGRGLPNVALRLGALYMVRGEWREAEAQFRDALAAMPGAVETHDALGCALLAQRRHDEAIDAFRAGLGCDYHSPLAHLHLGFALAAQRRWDEAGAAARTAQAQDPRLPGLRGLLEQIERRGVPA